MATGWNNGLNQDYSKKLGKWFANRLGARQQLREMYGCEEMNLERCNGKYDNLHSEFGKLIRRECIGCQRRMLPGAPMPVPEFAINCPKKVSETE